MGRHPSIHVTGAGGQVGIELRDLLPGAHFWTHAELDVTDAGAVAAALAEAGTVIHLAALTNVDECEQQPQRALSVNAGGTANVVSAAERTGARVVYVSTDYVFDGEKEGEYVEDDLPSPRNAYGASKLEGEEHVLGAAGPHLVVRTSWVYGRGRNFVATIVGAARAGKDVAVVDDQFGRPTWARELAVALASLAGSADIGVLHVAGGGEPCSWADLAEEAIGAAGLDAPVARIDTGEYARRAGKPLAPRPRNSVLSLVRARSGGIEPSDWRTSVRSYVEEMR